MFKKIEVPLDRRCRCFACGGEILATAKAVSARCAGCGRSVSLQDVIVRGAQRLGKVQTCGRLIVEKRGKLIASSIDAAEGVEVQGAIEAKVSTLGTVTLGPKAKWKGDCRAAGVVVQPGAVIEAGRFEIAGGEVGSCE